jgi:hypothetical protein
MTKLLFHDVVNDIAIIETSFCYWVRYGLDQTRFEFGYLSDAIKFAGNCLGHALSIEELNE